MTEKTVGKDVSTHNNDSSFCNACFRLLRSVPDNQKNVLSVEIKRPLAEVFKFTINPVNTPKWIDGIVEERTNEPQVQIGTIYKNRKSLEVEEWTTYKVVAFEQDRIFWLAQIDPKSSYNVTYLYEQIEGGTKLTYAEWVKSGKLEEPFTAATMEKLRGVLEQEAEQK